MEDIKKYVLIGAFFLLILVLTSITSYLIDSYRIDNRQEPIFIVRKYKLDDGGTTVYYGLGYQIIKWKIAISPNSAYVGIEKHYIIGIINPYKDKPSIELSVSRLQ